MRGGNIVSWPLRAAPAGPFPAGTGTVANPFNGMCMALAGNGTAVVAWTCSAGASSQQWTGYRDGTLRINGKCLDVTGPGVGAKVKIAACTGPASQPLRAHHRPRIQQCPDRPGRQLNQRHPAADGRQPRRSKRALARLVPPLHTPLSLNPPIDFV